MYIIAGKIEVKNCQEFVSVLLENFPAESCALKAHISLKLSLIKLRSSSFADRLSEIDSAQSFQFAKAH